MISYTVARVYDEARDKSGASEGGCWMGNSNFPFPTVFRFSTFARKTAIPQFINEKNSTKGGPGARDFSREWAASVLGELIFHTFPRLNYLHLRGIPFLRRRPTLNYD